MGNDGGSIPYRSDLVKTKAKAEQTDKQNQTIALWFFCALSKKLLQEPVVSCALGKLYNKDAIIEYLIDKASYGDGESICGHIRGLKDVTTLKLTPNPAPLPAGASETSRAAWVCPLTLKEMNGSLPFVYISTCGCVFSAAGLKAITPSDSPTSSSDDKSAVTENPSCPQCTKPFNRTTDVVTINPTPEVEKAMRLALDAKRLAAKGGKSKKRKAVEASLDKETVSGDAKRPKLSTPPANVSKPTTNASVAAVTRKVTESLAEEEIKRKATMSQAVASLYATKEGPKKKETFMTMGTFTRYA